MGHSDHLIARDQRRHRYHRPVPRRQLRTPPHLPLDRILSEPSQRRRNLCHILTAYTYLSIKHVLSPILPICAGHNTNHWRMPQTAVGCAPPTRSALTQDQLPTSATQAYYRECKRAPP